MRSVIFLSVLLTLSFCANGQEEKIKRYYAGDWQREIGYSEVTQVGSTLYISGVACSGKNMVEAVNECYDSLTNILEKFNTGSDHIVKENIYTTNIDELIKAIPSRRRFFSSGHYPAATWVQVERLFSPSHILEVELIVEL